jgi:hypothetical protein
MIDSRIRIVTIVLALALVRCGRPDAPDAADASPTPTPIAKTPVVECPEPPKPSLSTRLGTRLSEVVEKECDIRRADVRDPGLDATVAGKWKGRFEYELPSRTGGAIEIDFTVSGGVLSGTAVEIEGVETMRANLTGDVYESRQVVWLGTYFVGGTHSVLWTGTLDAAGTKIEGRWRLDQGSGTFVLERA